MTANFTPNRNEYKDLGQFRFWCQKVLPLVYDDSLSYYELLCKVVNYLNETIHNVELMGDDIVKLYTAYEELQTYVNNYFTNLDVQEEINNKLDSMASDGTLSTIVEPFLPNLVTGWLTANITSNTGVVDKSLSVSGASADAQVVGDEFKNSGRVFHLINANYGIFNYVYDSGEHKYTVKWVNTAPEMAFGVCGTVQKGLTNDTSQTSSSVVAFTEVSIVSESGFVALVYNVAEDTFGFKKYTECTYKDYALLVGYGNTVDYLGNFQFFTNMYLGEYYNVRKNLPFLSRRIETIGGTYNVNTEAKTLTLDNVVVLYGDSGQFTSSSKTLIIPYNSLAQPDYIWHLMYTPTTDEFVIVGRSELENLYKLFKYNTYYVVFSYYNSKYYNVTPQPNRFLVNGADCYASVYGSFKWSTLVLTNGLQGQLDIGVDSKTNKYYCKWVDDTDRTLYGLAGSNNICLTNVVGTANAVVFDSVTSDYLQADVGNKFSVLVVNISTKTISFKLQNQFTYGDYAIAIIYTPQNINFLGNDRYFTNFIFRNMYEVRKYIPFYGRKGEILSGSININTSEMRVYSTSNLVVGYNEYGGYRSDVTFDFDLNTLIKPKYVWFAMFNSTKGTIEIVGNKELELLYNSYDFTTYYLLFAYYKNKIFCTSSVPGIYYLNGDDYFGTNDSFNKYQMLSNKTYKIFRKVVCCGDSYTSGYITDSNGTPHETNEEYSWCHYMETDSGNTYVNCGESGSNVLTWQTAERGLLKAQGTGVVQAYIIGLGINDSSDSTRHVDVGVISDIGTDNQTFYGGLSKIIRELKAISPNAIIFVQNIPRTGSTYAPYNQAIKDVVEAYKDQYRVHLLDLYGHINLYQNPALTNDALNGHYTAIGYEVMAQNLAYIMSEYINANISKFQDVAFLPYNA